MSFTRQSFIDRAIETALVGLDTQASPASVEEGLVETLALNVVQDFAIGIANDPENHFLLQQNFSVALTNGVGTLPAKALPESIKSGAVYDADGNKLERVWFLGDLSQARSPLLGYYALIDKSIFTRQLGSGSLTDTTSPLSVTVNIIPDIDNLNTDVPSVIQSDLITLLAQRIRQAMLPTPA